MRKLRVLRACPYGESQNNQTLIDGLQEQKCNLTKQPLPRVMYCPRKMGVLYRCLGSELPTAPAAKIAGMTAAEHTAVGTEL